MQGSRLQRNNRLRTRPAAVEQFPPLTQDAPSQPPHEYYHPASFPGYSALLTDEQQALLRRSVSGTRQTLRPRIRRGYGRLVSWRCLATTLLMAMAFTWSFLYVIQHIQWDEQCPTETQADQQFVFDNHRPLHIDCRDHTSLSNIRIVPATNQTTVHVRVEASSWWRNRINIDHNQGSSGNSLKVKVRQTPWGWLRGCVRATVVVALPETLALQVDSDSGTVLVRNVDMKALRVATAHGRISIIDVHTQDSLDLNGHNTMIELTRVSAPRISATTVNAGIRATNVTGSEVTLHTANAGLVLRRVHTDVLRAQSSNGAIHGDARVQREVDLVTSNGALQMDIQGSTTTEFIAAHSSNGPVGLGLLSVAGIFSVQASGSTADIIADKEKLRLDKDSTSAKTGAFAQGSTRISVSTSNSQAILRLS